MSPCSNMPKVSQLINFFGAPVSVDYFQKSVPHVGVWEPHYPLISPSSTLCFTFHFFAFLLALFDR